MARLSTRSPILPDTLEYIQERNPTAVIFVKKLSIRNRTWLLTKQFIYGIGIYSEVVRVPRLSGFSCSIFSCSQGGSFSEYECTMKSFLCASPLLKFIGSLLLQTWTKIRQLQSKQSQQGPLYECLLPSTNLVWSAWIHAAEVKSRQNFYDQKLLVEGSHRLEKYLNLEVFHEKSLKIKSALKKI